MEKRKFRPEAEYYDAPECRQFVEEMRDAGFLVQHYRGRNMWQGPAVICTEVANAQEVTDVPCQHDTLGKDYVVYPLGSGCELNAAGKVAENNFVAAKG